MYCLCLSPQGINQHHPEYCWLFTLHINGVGQIWTNGISHKVYCSVGLYIDKLSFIRTKVISININKLHNNDITCII